MWEIQPGTVQQNSSTDNTRHMYEPATRSIYYIFNSMDWSLPLVLKVKATIRAINPVFTSPAGRAPAVQSFKINTMT
jgi:3-methyladenine DNA glycosylase Mpg